MRTLLAGVAVFVLACSRAPGPDGEDSSGTAVAGDTTSLTVPDRPHQRPERLVTAAVATRRDIDASGSWHAEAALCRRPPLVQLIAQDPAFGAIILFAPPEGGGAAGVYDILEGTANLPDSSTARVGVQVYPEGARPAAFVGIRGTLEIESLNATLVGHLAVIAEEPRYSDTIFLSGAFDVAVRNGSDASCRVMGDPLD